MFMLEQWQLVMACGVLLREKVIWSFFLTVSTSWKGGGERLLHVPKKGNCEGVWIDHI